MLVSNIHKLKVDAFPSLLLNSPAEQDVKNIKKKISTFNSCYLEIGSGSGMHLIEQAKLSPSTLWIGLEKRYKRAVRTAEKAEEQGINNILILRTSAENLLIDFDKLSFDGIYVLFPDPWPKRRHLKKRIMSEENLNLFSRLLKKSGFIVFKTDHLEYFNFVLEEVKKVQSLVSKESSTNYHKDFNSSIFLNSSKDLPGKGQIKSEFENLFISQNEQVNYLYLRKKGGLFTF